MLKTRRSSSAMDSDGVELQALRFYGQEGPIAIINDLGVRKAYTMAGIDALISVSENTNRREQLRFIKHAMIQARQKNYEGLPDVNGDDVSGQETIF